MAAPSVAALDALPPDEAAAFLGLLFEGAPSFVGRLVAARPFGSEAGLFGAAESIASGLTEAEAIELVNAHPRLGASPGTVSALSFGEQGYDRRPDERDAGSPAADRLEALNDAYEARFGFRYCVWVAGRSREALVPEWEARLASGEREAELRRALRDVVAIARDRYRRLAAEGAEGTGEEGAA